MKRTDTATLIAALRILARDMESGDGVANAAISEAADRLEEMQKVVGELRELCKAARGLKLERHWFVADIAKVLQKVPK